MIDARNVFRKVNRTINDFSPEQMANLSAIVWLYRGQKERFLALVQRYLKTVAAECLASGPAVDAFEATLAQVREPIGTFARMPNHVHILTAFASEEAMLAQCESWKHYMARHINALLGRKGRFWEPDAFDHLVRSPEEFERLQVHAENPLRAGLRAGEYLHYRKE
jgi:REP element-mobilizing transposase RayT